MFKINSIFVLDDMDNIIADLKDLLDNCSSLLFS